jgi:thiol-disulfide isomerase/thioredoxin
MDTYTSRTISYPVALVLMLPLTLLLAACGGTGAPASVGSTRATTTTGDSSTIAVLPSATVPAVHPSPLRQTPAPVAAGAERDAPVDVPDFGLVSYQGDDLLGGHETSFANVFAHGEPVVLNFWAGLCPPCRAEMPAFQRVADEYAGKVIFVGVDVGPYIGLGSQDDARRLLDELGIQYPAAYAADASPLQLYEVLSMPTTLFLTADGRLVHKQSGLLLETQLRTRVEALAAGS